MTRTLLDSFRRGTTFRQQRISQPCEESLPFRESGHVQARPDHLLRHKSRDWRISWSFHPNRTAVGPPHPPQGARDCGYEAGKKSSLIFSVFEGQHAAT